MGFSFVAPFILVFMMVSLRRKRIILSSSSSTISLSMSSKVCLSIVSKADDMSIPVILISTSSFSDQYGIYIYEKIKRNCDPDAPEQYD